MKDRGKGIADYVIARLRVLGMPIDKGMEATVETMAQMAIGLYPSVYRLKEKEIIGSKILVYIVDIYRERKQDGVVPTEFYLSKFTDEMLELEDKTKSNGWLGYLKTRLIRLV